MSELSAPPLATAPDLSFVTLSITEGVADVVLTPSGKASRQGPDFWLGMPGLFSWLDRNPQVRVVVLRGGGEGFSSGLDLVGMVEDLGPVVGGTPGAADRDRLYEMILRMQQATTAVAACRKPVIAAVHGWCIGAGVDLISACDVRLCSADAKFSVREARMAIVADMGSLARLPGIIGQGATRELALTGDDIDAARALELGLVSRVHPTVEALLEAARAMAGRIAANPPLIVQGIKRVLNAGSEREAALSLQFVAAWNAAFLPSKDLTEAMTAFMEKRPPAFTGD